ncbi:UNVERIFIED_CONTAM: hypothetical protein PYX00_010540 [Menopon gallinae]|uniref:Protein Asterix n=1 Tax=Menopon gallinae TaxID=328185 RepID=A0AAW2HFT3_9NEOP
MSTYSKSVAQKGTGEGGDVKRTARHTRYKAPSPSAQGATGEDMTPDYMNILGIVFSMCGLMLKLKWCAWVALYCSCVSFANCRVNDDNKQTVSSFILSISAVVMSYIQNPQPMSPPWASSFSS